MPRPCMPALPHSRSRVPVRQQIEVDGGTLFIICIFCKQTIFAHKLNLIISRRSLKDISAAGGIRHSAYFKKKYYIRIWGKVIYRCIKLPLHSAYCYFDTNQSALDSVGDTYFCHHQILCRLYLLVHVLHFDIFCNHNIFIILFISYMLWQLCRQTNSFIIISI